MPVPTFDQLLRPVLELAAKTGINRQIATAAMVQEFSLTEEEQKEAISSGAPKTANRTGWAMSHLTKAALIEKVAKFTYKATQKGTDYLKNHSGPITVVDLKQIEDGRRRGIRRPNRRRANPRVELIPFSHQCQILPRK